jgi:3-oxoacyl-[acyl-carrier-protein] synthase I
VRNVYLVADNIITPLGFTTGENARSMIDGKTGIRLITDETLAPEPFYASIISNRVLDERFSDENDPSKFTRFEKLAILSLRNALSGIDDYLKNQRTLFILSTTKGNIDLLRENPVDDRLFLWNTARLLKDYFGLVNKPVIVSDACISGVQAIITAVRFIESGLYDHAIINGTDIISEFVLSGFNSFKSLSNGPCRPFDKTRDGLSLGEGSGTIILTSDSTLCGNNKIVVGPGFSTNDANHISGPSRTGEGLFLAISRVLKHSVRPVDYISAHGTATLYNDEMESVAITRAGLQDVPVNSFKGYWGHTLGAAGIIESVMGVHSLKNNILFRTAGFKEPGVTNPINVIDKVLGKDIGSCLKIASGFGGCNAAALFYRI